MLRTAVWASRSSLTNMPNFPLNFLGDLTTRRGTQDVTFTVVGYGVNSYKPRFEYEGTRYQATSKLINLGSALIGGVNLMTTNNPGNDCGGTCSGDSGGPILYSEYYMIVAVNSFGISTTAKAMITPIVSISLSRLTSSCQSLRRRPTANSCGSWRATGPRSS